MQNEEGEEHPTEGKNYCKVKVRGTEKKKPQININESTSRIKATTINNKKKT